MTNKCFFISDSVTQFLLRTFTNNKQHKYDESNTRIKKDDTISEWFIRTVKTIGGVENIFTLDDTIAVLPQIMAKDDCITKMSIQAFISLSDSIVDSYKKLLKGKDTQAVYCRLDFHPIESGVLFSHPMPHLHIGVLETPRLPLAYTSWENSILDFLEFLYVNYKYNVWLDWVRKEWNKKYGMKQQSDPYDDSNYFDAIENGFKEGKICDSIFLKKYGDTIDNLKELLEQRKRFFSEKLFKLSPCCFRTNYIGAIK